MIYIYLYIRRTSYNPIYFIIKCNIVHDFFLSLSFKTIGLSLLLNILFIYLFCILALTKQKSDFLPDVTVTVVPFPQYSKASSQREDLR